MFTLTPHERDRRWKRARNSMENRCLDCLIVCSSFGSHRGLAANLRYLSNATAEGYLLFPLKGEPTLFTFLGGFDPTSWVTDCRSGHPEYSRAISERLGELQLENASIGIVGLSGYYAERGFSYTAYISLINSLPSANFEDATDIVEEARRIKSAEELSCIEEACEVADKVIQSVVDTAGVGVKDYEIKAKIIDTLFREGSEPGSMLLYCSGKELNHAGQGGYYKPADTRALEYGDVILIEFDARCSGYMTQYNQPFSVGKPNKEWGSIFDVVLEAFNNGLKTLRPGIMFGELDEALLSPIQEAGYTYTHPAFHGIGLSLEEPIGIFPLQPLYKLNTSLNIEEGMVIELEPHVVTLDKKKGVHLGSPVVVTETGCKLLSKTWEPGVKIV